MTWMISCISQLPDDSITEAVFVNRALTLTHKSSARLSLIIHPSYCLISWETVMMWWSAYDVMWLQGPVSPCLSQYQPGSAVVAADTGRETAGSSHIDWLWLYLHSVTNSSPSLLSSSVLSWSCSPTSVSSAARSTPRTASRGWTSSRTR